MVEQANNFDLGRFLNENSLFLLHFERYTVSLINFLTTLYHCSYKIYKKGALLLARMHVNMTKNIYNVAIQSINIKLKSQYKLVCFNIRMCIT